jgi:hypothetical protein
MYYHTEKPANADGKPDFILKSKDGISRSYWLPAAEETVILTNPADPGQRVAVTDPSALKLTTWPDGKKHLEIITTPQALTEYENAPGDITLLEF